MPRLFIAVDLPEAVKDDLREMQDGVPGAKWVTRARMHLTLRFLGETDSRAFFALKSRLVDIQFAAFDLTLRGVGRFPAGKKAARVLWVGVADNPALVALQQQIETTVQPLGFAPDPKPFSPHITLARLKAPPPPATVAQFLERHADYAAEAIPIREFILYSSQLDRAGAIYTQEAVYSLKDD